MGTDYRILEKEFADRCESLFQNTQLNQGDVFFFNRRLVHRGGKNLSDKRRNALVWGGRPAQADAMLVGCAKAGSSTALGFVSAQSLQNLVTPAGQCWVD